MKRPSLRHVLTLLGLCGGLLCSAPSQAMGPLGWFLVDQAFSRLPTPFVGQSVTINGTLDPRITLLMYQQTQEAAEILNRELPIDVGNGLYVMRANALGAGLLGMDLTVLNANASDLPAEFVDAQWGVDLRSQVCQGSFFNAWMSRGGSLQFTIRGKDQMVARQYYANALNCAG